MNKKDIKELRNQIESYSNKMIRCYPEETQQIVLEYLNKDTKNLIRYKELIRLYGLNYANKIFIRRIQLKQKLPNSSEIPEYKIKKLKTILSNQRKSKKTKIEKLIKKKKKEVKRVKYKTLKNLALSLENNLPQSEKWFRELYEKHLKIDSDRYNEVYKNIYIPDVINHEYKYIIEIDGTIHLTVEQQNKDLHRNQYFRDQGFKVLRIQAYDYIQYIQVMRLICKIRKIEEPEIFKKFTLQYFNK